MYKAHIKRYYSESSGSWYWAAFMRADAKRPVVIAGRLRVLYKATKAHFKRINHE